MAYPHLRGHRGPRTPALSLCSSAEQASKGIWAGSVQERGAGLLLGALGAPRSLPPSTLTSLAAWREPGYTVVTPAASRGTHGRV